MAPLTFSCTDSAGADRQESVAFPKDTPSGLRKEARLCAAACFSVLSCCSEIAQEWSQESPWLISVEHPPFSHAAHPMGWTAVVGSIPERRAGAGLALCYDVLSLASLRADLICSPFPDDPSDCLLTKETSCL